MDGNDLGRRLMVAGVGIPCGVMVVYLGVWSVGVVLSIVAAIGVREVYLIAGASGGRPFQSLGIIASALLVLSAALTAQLAVWSIAAVTIVLGLSLVALVSAVFCRGPADRPLASVATTVLGVVYVGVTLSFAVHLRGFPGVADGGIGWDGALILIFPLTVTWVGDSVAYFSGHRWGRTKLLPSVSPGKTVAGAIGGLLGAMVTATLFAGFLINPHSGALLPWLSAALVGLIVGCVSQVGDLAESLLKREACVKDSGTLFPGHGGVLDRFDSIFFSLPVTYALFHFLLEP